MHSISLWAVLWHSMWFETETVSKRMEMMLYSENRSTVNLERVKMKNFLERIQCRIRGCYANDPILSM